MESYQHKIELNMERKSGKKNLQCHDGILICPEYITNDIQWFYFQYLLLKAT